MHRTQSLQAILLAALMTSCLGCASGGGGGGGGEGGSSSCQGPDCPGGGGSTCVGDDCGTGGGGGGSSTVGCAGVAPGTAGANELPRYDLLPTAMVPRIIRLAEKPAQVDLSDSVPAPCNQGHINTCVGWAGGYALMTYLAAVNIEGWGSLELTENQFSPTFIFNQVNAFKLGKSSRDSCMTAGTFLSDMFTLIRDVGCPTWAQLPYTENDCVTGPGVGAVASAAAFRVPYFVAVERDIATMQSFLNIGVPIVVTLRVGNAFSFLSRDEVLSFQDVDDTFAHSVVVVGYDDDLAAIKVMNSWGRTWADGGFAFISYDVWEAIAREAYVVGNELVTDSDTDADAEKAMAAPGSRSQRRLPITGCELNPLFDTDRDGYADTIEILFGLDPDVPDDNPDLVPVIDADTDGWPDETEIAFGSDLFDARDFPYDCDFQYRSGFFDVFLGQDDDADFIPNDTDNCPLVPNFVQDDVDGDGLGDACDNCVFDPNPDQADANGNGLGDVCENTTGACCGLDGQCQELTLSICLANGGQFRDAGSTCAGITLCPSLLGYDSTATTLWNISRSDGSSIVQRSGGLTTIQGLTTHPTDSTLLLGASNTGNGSELVSIDLNDVNADATIGFLNSSAFTGLTTDPNSGTVYGVTSAGAVFEVDPTDASTTALGELATGNPYGALAFDPATGQLYAARNSLTPNASAELVSVTLLPFRFDVVGPLTGHSVIGGLTVLDGVLYALTQDTQRLISLTIAGNTITIADLGPAVTGSIGGLAGISP